MYSIATYIFFSKTNLQYDPTFSFEKKLKSQDFCYKIVIAISTLYFKAIISLINRMWKFQDFSTTQILREINMGVSQSSKTATFAFYML